MLIALAMLFTAGGIILLSTRKSEASTSIQRSAAEDIELTTETASKSDTPRSTWEQWLWPLQMVDGVRPFISDGFYTPEQEPTKRGGRGHFGIDIDHKVSEAPALFRDKPDFLRGTKFRSNGFFIFPGELVFTAGPGKIWSAKKTGTGHTVQISHIVDGRPYLSVYRHLSSLQPNLERGRIVAAGEPLGPVGGNPQDTGSPDREDPGDFAHLHFEIWDVNRAGSGREADSINPASIMRVWRVIDSTTKLPVKYPR